jgi:hypothetical protein
MYAMASILRVACWGVNIKDEMTSFSATEALCPEKRMQSHLSIAI